MKIKPLLEKLRSDWPAKAVCVAAACLLYLFNRYASLEQKSVPVRLELIQDGEMAAATHIPSSVSVTVRTSSENIGKITAENISAQLDMSWITKEGTYDVPVSVDLPSSIVELSPLQVTVYPEKVKARLERNTVRLVKALAQTAGEPQDGYVVESVQVDPPYVSIYGPRSIVQGVESIATEGISVDGASASFSQKTRLLNINRMIKIQGGEEAEVTVNVDYQTGTKEFAGLSVALRNRSPAFEYETRDRGSITLKGPRLLMDEWTPNPDTLSADLGDITAAGTYEIPVSVLIPQEFRLESASLDNARVVVKERPPAIVVDETLPGATFSEAEEDGQ